MDRIIQYVRTGGDLTDDELAALINERMLRIPPRTQRNWLRQLLLALDGYGAPKHVEPSEKIRVVVRKLEASLPPAGSTPAAPSPPVEK
jgi:hypothetical protein